MRLNRIIICLMVAVSTLLSSCGESQRENQGVEAEEGARPYSIWMAESEMDRRAGNEPRWTYVPGLVNMSILSIWEMKGEEKYYEYVKSSYIDQLVEPSGSIRGYDEEEYNIDHVNAGKMLFPLYEETQQPRYKLAMETLMAQLNGHPRVSEGGFWHKNIYPHQMWLDGLYMASPFYAEYLSKFGVLSDFDDVTNQIILMHKYLHDEKSGLYYHGWDESRSIFWADPDRGRSDNFWGRGMGWFYMGLIDILEFLPEEHKDRQKVVRIFVDLTDALLRHRDPETGLWYQVVDMPDREGNYLESSASSMFAYGMFKGMRMGILDESTYLNPAMESYNSILKHFITVEQNGNISINSVCRVAGLGPEGNTRRDGSFEYYMSEPVVSNDGKATGPFILASLMVESSSKWREMIRRAHRD